MQDKQQMEQVKQLAEMLGLDDFTIEKDIYVTKAIWIVTQIKNEFYELVFQGGTSLAKAHRIIERMSEDCDFRIRIKPAAQILSKERKRKALRQFRHEILDALRVNGFAIDSDTIRTRNEGKFMGVRAQYPSLFPYVQGMRPFLSLEFFLNEVKVETESKPVTTLIKQVLGNKVDYQELPVSSVSIIETAAEKWVALTRRVAVSAERKHYRDATLVRHLYDLYKIDLGGFFTEKFQQLVPSIVEEDRRQYKNHSDAYYQDPVGEINRAVDELQTSSQWRDHWDRFVDIMVFEQTVIPYEAVLSSLVNKTNTVLSCLNQAEFAEV